MIRKCIAALVVVFLATAAFANPESDFEYSLFKDKKKGDYIVITRYIGKSSVCEIPAKISGFPVREIVRYVHEQGVDYGCKPIAPADKIKELVLPDTLETIGARAFENQVINTVTIPASVVEINQRAFANSGIRNLVVKPRKEKLTVKAGAFKNNHLTELNLPSGVNYVFDNDRAPLTFKADIGEPVFSGNDFEKLVIEPNWYGRALANFSGCIDYDDTRGKLKEVVYKPGCKSLSYIRSKTLQAVSIPKTIGVDEKGKQLKNFSNAWFCAPKLKVADVHYEKGGIWGMAVWQAPTSAQKLQYELDGLGCSEISAEVKNAPEGVRVGAYTDSR